MEVSGCCLLSFLVLVAVQEVVSAVDGARCPPPLLANGVASLRSRGRIVRYKCNRMFRAVGPMYATCINGEWDAEPPVCARPGCPPFRDPQNGNRELTFRNSVAFITCNVGFYLNGSRTLFCDGKKWNGTLPQCIAEDTEAATFCDFDTLCGWSQDPSDDADWLQNSYAVPSRNLSTGPDSDHTYGKGFGGRYMYASSQSPRKENDLTRLVSPVYPASLTADSSCFIFWYHMFGAAMGSLRVYQKLANESLSVVQAGWAMHGDQGDKWQQGMMSLSTFAAPFQIVMEAVRGRDVQSVIAIDDVSLESGANCSLGATVTVDDGSMSCESRCSEDSATASNSDCACNSDCESRGNCCADYKQFCTNASSQGNATISTTPLSIPTRVVLTTASTVVTTITPTTQKTIPTTQKPTTSTQKPTTTTQRPTTTTQKPTTTTQKPTTTTQKPTPTTQRPTPTTQRPTPTTQRPTPTTQKITTRRAIPTPRSTTPTTRQTTVSIRIYTRPTTPTQPRTTTTPRLIRTTQSFTRPEPTTPSTAMLTAKITPAAVAGADENEPSMALMVFSAIAVCASILLVSGVVVVLVRRYRLRARARELDCEDSDVRFLTASDGEIQLDFTLATPHL